jgi:hypothetical protein
MDEALFRAKSSLVFWPPATGTYRSDDAINFDDMIARALIATRPMQRLAGIGFLGAIDYVRHGSGRSPHRRRHNRLEHSIGVAHLADLYARGAELSESRRLLLIAAALLHDVGHGPLSHTLEPVFEAEFGINHHSMTRRIVTGTSPLGHEIRDLLLDARIDLEEVLALIEGQHDGDVGFLFSGQINLDTLDGITRCRAFMARRTAPGSARTTVLKWARETHPPLADFDTFWKLKHDVYNLFIGAPHGAVLDAIAQAYMRSALKEFSSDDFYLTERTFRRSYRPLFHYLDQATRSRSKLFNGLPGNWLNQDVTLKSRSFFICTHGEAAEQCSINKRYRQTKRILTKKLADVIEETL